MASHAKIWATALFLTILSIHLQLAMNLHLRQLTQAIATTTPIGRRIINDLPDKQCSFWQCLLGGLCGSSPYC
ncbi:hypothetical protein O6H91_09G022100 [Diphasiastrum complanatum]|uniref:Uncharacterized protein n=1 Tax=Diphasiastrum complanatum TaxID=34168 RepID=A0ACC2CLY6_DIPCM|nr:hypothetical protein O6H91_Y122200 [Diphasiastrum complanatum]KAJ7543015.1 hypothetical protein O6H91_09G022100 [Diphasiastrum complanatum]